MLTRLRSRKNFAEEKKDDDITLEREHDVEVVSESSTSLEEQFNKIVEAAKSDSRKKTKLNEDGKQNENEEQEDRKPEAVKDKGYMKPSMQIGNEKISEPQEKMAPEDGKHVASLKNPPPAVKRQSPTVLNEDDLGVIYDYVLNDGKDSNLNYTQRIYYQGAMSDSYYSMQGFADKQLGGDIQKMQNAANDMVDWAKQSREKGDIKMAVAQLTDSKAMNDIAKGKVGGIVQQAKNIMAV